MMEMAITIVIVLLIKDIIYLKVNEWARAFGYRLIISDNLTYLFIAIIMVMVVETILTLSIKLFKR